MSLAACGGDDERDLSTFKHDAQARTLDFFAAIGRDLPDGPAETALKIGDAFLRKHMCARLNALFKLPRSVAGQVIIEAGGHEGWVDSIEEFSGFSFRERSVPESFDLVKSQQSISMSTTGETRVKKELKTLSQQLAHDGTLLDEKLPAACFSRIETPNYRKNTIKDTELHRTLDEVAAYVISRHQTLKIGKNLAEIYARQVRTELPNLPPRGKIPGSERDVAQMILDKVKNRTYVSASI